MKQILQPFQAVLDRLAEFFFLFDLSFLVSGAAAFSAVVLAWHLADVPRLALEGGLQIFAVLIACYLSGLLCFAVGSWLRNKLPAERGDRFDVLLREILITHGIDRHPVFATYFQRADEATRRRAERTSAGTADEGDGAKDEDGVDEAGDWSLWRLYTRMWAESRDLIPSSPSWSLLQRYWVMTATYDGLAAALLVWVTLILVWMLGFGLVSRLSPWLGVPALLLLLAFVAACFHEAGRLKRYQMEELAATVARLAEPALAPPGPAEPSNG
jgi:hypothetical protein